MPNFNAYTLLKWLHLVFFAVAGGGAVVALILSGFEDTREDLRGLAAAVWKRVTTWTMRIALLLGIALLVIKFQRGDHPFDHSYLHLKLVFAGLALFLAEGTPRHLASGKRGSAMLFLFLWMLTTFVTVNKNAFPVKYIPADPPAVLSPLRN